MSKKEDTLDYEGQIIEVLPNQVFRIMLENEHQITAYTGGKMRQHKIRLVLGDKVRVEMTPYDLSKGRIIHRL
jgi:translation initiation factor IF-1